MALDFDIIIFGGGIAGLWLGNVLVRKGYNAIVVEKDKLGGGQTLASQGMIHGGQKYQIQNVMALQADVAAKMPERWEACIEGRGEIDLTGVRVLSPTQVMWPAGSFLSSAGVWLGTKRLSLRSIKLQPADFPEALRLRKNFKGPVYELPEAVVDVESLIRLMAANLQGRVFQGEISELSRDGKVMVSDQKLHAQLIIFTAGTGNELALELLHVNERRAQRRPLRQIMVRPLPYQLFGHGIVASPQPRVTVTSHACGNGEYVWYLGGALAEQGATLDEGPALAHAKNELKEIFPQIDWDQKEWATWLGDRAEPYNDKGRLPPGPFVERHDRVLIAWPTKLTFAPALSDRVLQQLAGISPMAKSLPPPLPLATVASYPWGIASWRNLG
ncbi:MAG TPA: FAD-dependent oxidoreductase [Bradyrhizobium sp.]|nr:FAD-dependent oxidoreductase [Bradyrhizobium sp.]